MTALGSIGFRNAQGHSYEFHIYPMNAAFKPGQGGVYVVTSRNDGEGHHHGHRILFVGETADFAQALAEHEKSGTFEGLNANCCCIHHVQEEKSRKHIAAELTAKYMKH